jgi:hypothetical protein
MVDPFAAMVKVESPPASVAARPVAAPVPHALPVLVRAQPVVLPPGLRVLLIGEQGRGLLGSVEAGALSIHVVNGKVLRLAEQDYHAEVTTTEIRLYAASHGKLVWEGALAGTSSVTVPVDLTQVRFVPPLSAGVNPGLKSAASTMGAAGPFVTKLSESQ